MCIDVIVDKYKPEFSDLEHCFLFFTWLFYFSCGNTADIATVSYFKLGQGHE